MTRIEERWAIADHAALTWREWDGEFVIYDDRSGQVHRLEGLAAEIFETLLAAPADRAGLAIQVTTALEVEQTPEISDAIDTVLRELLISGVVAPVAVA